MVETKNEIQEIVKTNFGIDLRLVFKDLKLIKVSFEKPFQSLINTKKADKQIVQFVKQLENYLNGERVNFSIPIDLADFTDFEKKVFLMCKKIPYGKTVSYKEIAIQLGNKNLSRAVGNALRKNLVPIIIPCHRVISSDGALGGYQGKSGIKIKKYLLDLEQPKIK